MIGSANLWLKFRDLVTSAQGSSGEEFIFCSLSDLPPPGSPSPLELSASIPLSSSTHIDIK